MSLFLFKSKKEMEYECNIKVKFEACKLIKGIIERI